MLSIRSRAARSSHRKGGGRKHFHLTPSDRDGAGVCVRSQSACVTLTASGGDGDPSVHPHVHLRVMMPGVYACASPSLRLPRRADTGRS